MTPLLEKIVAIIAPFYCIVCSKEDNVICLPCLASHFSGLDSVCVFCVGLTEECKVCKACRTRVQLNRVWVAAQYKGVAEKTIHDFKFERSRAAYQPLAAAIEGVLSFLPKDTVIVPVPTAQRRIRVRGYDQSVLIAKELARLRQLPYSYLLERRADVRQLGATRRGRLEQASDMFSVNGNVVGKKILLVDDVCTTGATLQAASAVLHGAGAKEINAAVVAWVAPKNIQG